MGLFDSVRGLVSGDDEPGDDDADAAVPERRDPTPTTFRNKAADAVADWDAHELDYSLDSLSRLDDFADKQGAKLDVMHDEGDEDVADLHTRYTIQAGSYLGEVLVRQRDGEWVEDGERWAVSLEYDGDLATVDVFELAGHSFAEEPVFGEVADRFTEDDDDQAEDPEPDPVDTSDIEAHAEELADFWDEYDLNFSPRSLARLDELADSEWDDDRFADAELGAADMDSGMFTELVKQLGSYYGETLVRSLDAEWTRRDDDIVVAVEGNTNAPPVPVPVFSVAADSLTGPSVFATRFNDLTDRANLEVPEVATTAGVTPSTGTPAATNREDGDLTAVQPDSETDGDEADVDTDTETPATATTETTDAPVDTAQAADAETGADPQSVDGSVVTESDETDTASVDEDQDEGDDTDPLAASVVGGADDDPSTDGDSEGATDTESSEPTETDDGTDTGPDETTDTGDGRAGDEVADTEPTVDPEGKSPVETAIAETVAAGLVDRPEEDAEADDGESAPAAPDASANGSDPDEDAEREALAAEISDSGPAESGPTLPTPAELHDNAEAFAATYPGYDLDFSPDSLERLDRLVTEEYDAATFADFDLADPDSQFQIDRVTEAGGYFALVIEGTVGGEWQHGEEGLQFVVEGANGVARLDPLGVAAGCFRGDDSFAATYAAIRDRLGA